MSWSNTYEFLFTCLLYVVGLGNILRFPELAYKNGGGAFLVPYLLSLILIGIPLFYLEVAIGQYASLGPISIWRVSPIFKGVGYGIVISNILTSISYNVTISWAMFYFFTSMQKVLPWTLCQTEFPQDGCINGSHIENAADQNDTISKHLSRQETTTPTVKKENNTIFNFTSVFITTDHAAKDLHNITTSTLYPASSTSYKGHGIHPSEQYFYREFLKVSDGLENFGYPHWRLCLCLLLAWVIIFLILTKGVKSAGKMALILTPFCYLTLAAFLIQSFVTDSVGASKGIRYFVTPHWEYLAKPSVWYDAVSQLFFSLSILQGGLMTLSSYNKFHHNIYRAAILIPVLDTLTSIFASLTLFSVLGVMANKKGINISDQLRGFTGTAFITFTEAVTMLPVPQLWSIIFFLMLVCLGLGSQYVAVETTVTALMDEYHGILPKKRQHVIASICGIMFILGIPLTCKGGIYLQAIVNKFSSSYAIMILALVFNIALTWVYGIDQVTKDIKAMLGHEVHLVWKILWKFVTPLLLLTMLIFSFVSHKPLDTKTYFIEYEFPAWSLVIGWLVFAVQIIPLFVSAITLYLTTPKVPFRKKIKKLASPSLLWGPSLEVHRLESISSSTEDTSLVSRRAFDKTGSVKTGKDIGGLDSIFSGTVGNNVLVKMAMNLAATNKTPPKQLLSKTTSMKKAKLNSPDMLAKRMESVDGGPIMFEEDGETYMLVPKRKSRPPSADKSTQTVGVYQKKASSMETAASFSSNKHTNPNNSKECITRIDSSKVEIVVDDCIDSKPRGIKQNGIDNPIIVIESFHC